jgi:hypothetical protein
MQELVVNRTLFSQALHSAYKPITDHSNQAGLIIGGRIQ